MKSRELDKRVDKAFAAVCPDILDSVLKDSAGVSGAPVEIFPGKRRRRPSGKILRAAAVLLLCIMSFSALGLYGRAYAVSTRLSLEAGTELELELNSSGRVIRAAATDEAGQELISGCSLKGQEAGEAVDTLLELMLAGRSAGSTVLITAEDKNEARAEELLDELSEALPLSLSSRGISAALLTQAQGEDPEIPALAAELEISPGRAQLISGISALSPELETGALAELSMDELGFIAGISGRGPQGLGISGSLSIKGLSPPEAEAEAEASLGISGDIIRNCSTRLGILDGELFYSVSFDSGIFNYSLELDPVSGEILQSSEAYAEDFSLWLEEQSIELQGWVEDNTMQIQRWVESYSGDWQAWFESHADEIAGLAAGLVESLLGLFDIIL